MHSYFKNQNSGDSDQGEGRVVLALQEPVRLRERSKAKDRFLAEGCFEVSCGFLEAKWITDNADQEIDEGEGNPQQADLVFVKNKLRWKN